MGYYEKEKICISVIMPSLNVAKYMRECLESVLNQKLREIEILCVDAGSTDGTLEILEEFALKDSRIRIIKSEKKSYGYQLNIGISVAKGEYIGIVETDDYIDVSMYETLYNYALKNQRPDYIKGGYVQFAEVNGRKIFSAFNRSRLKKIFNDFICLEDDRKKGILDLNHIWSGIYRREFLLREGIKLNETPGASYQDLSFSLLAGLLADACIYTEEKYYFYRIDNINSSVKSNSKWRCVIDEFEYVVQELIKRKKYFGNLETLVWMQKPGIYFWNLQRLSEEEGERFRMEIQQEVEEFKKNDEYNHCLDESQRAALEFLKSQEVLTNYITAKRELVYKIRYLLQMIGEGKKFVLVSAGRLAERMIFLQDALNEKYIEAVADSNIVCQGQIWNKYVLLSVQEAVQKYKENDFIIVNKNASIELRECLSELGVTENKIYVFDNMLPVDELIMLVSEKEVS